MAKLTEIEGVGEVFAQKLADAGVHTTDELLEKAATPKGRAEIAEKAQVSEKQVLGWTNRVDLFRVKGVGSEYADLLEVSGVDTVPELAQRNPEHLFKKMIEVNDEKHLVRGMPTEGHVEGWVAQAKKLPRKITY